MACDLNPEQFSDQEELKQLQDLLYSSFRHLHSKLDERESLLSNTLTLIYRQRLEAERDKLCKVEKMKAACDTLLSSILDTNLLEANTVTLKPIQDQIEELMRNRQIINFKYSLEPLEIAIGEFGNFITVLDREVKTSNIQQEPNTEPDKIISKVLSTKVNIGRPIPGLCGLYCIGDYSHISSILQCLLHTQPFVDNFKNESIAGGSKVCFNSLKEISDGIHSGTEVSINPKGNKLYTSNPPTDTYLYLRELLPCLHRELNRVVENVCIDMPYSCSQDNEVSKLAWNLYTMCNQSIISDTFHGQCKFTTTCLGCNKQSFLFDFFSSLSLSLQIMQLEKKDDTRNIKLTLIFLNPTTKPIKGNVVVRKNASISDLCLEVSSISGIASDKLLVCEVYSHRFHKTFDKNESISGITERDDIFVYETPVNSIDDPDLMCLPVYNRELRRTQYTSITSHTYVHHYLFGMPLVLPLPRDTTTYSDLYRICVYFMQRYIEKHNVSAQSNRIPTFESIANGCVPESFNISEYPSDMFIIKLVNAYGSAEMGELKNDGQYLKLSASSVLALEWNSKHRDLYNETKLRDIEEIDTFFHKFTITLQQSINYYLTRKLEPESHPIDCTTCNKKEQVYKQNELWILPQCLIVHLKRFKDNDKIYSLVNFPFELDMSEFIHTKDQGQAKYHLAAVCNHHGGIAGHYTASIKHTDGEWYRFDDSTVSHYLYPQSVVTNAAYILFYERIY